MKIHTHLPAGRGWGLDPQRLTEGTMRTSTQLRAGYGAGMDPDGAPRP